MCDTGKGRVLRLLVRSAAVLGLVLSMLAMQKVVGSNPISRSFQRPYRSRGKPEAGRRNAPLGFEW